MADSTSGTLTLPTFDIGQTYLLKGETLQQITAVIKENKVVLTGKKQYDEIGPDGSKLSLDDVFKFPEPADTEKTYVWFAEFNAGWIFSWRETTECECNTIDGGSA